MGTSIGAVIDYFTAGLPAVLQAVDPNVVVADNAALVMPTSSLLVVGREGPDSPIAATGTGEYVELGANRIEEAYELPCYAQAYLPGPAQKPARDRVLALYDATVAYIRADLTLGGLLTRGRIGFVNRFQLQQTATQDDSPSGGQMFAHLDFAISIKTTYLP